MVEGHETGQIDVVDHVAVDHEQRFIPKEVRCLTQCPCGALGFLLVGADLLDTWRAGLVGRPDAVQSTVALVPAFIPPNGVSTTTMQIALRDWQGLPISVPIQSVRVRHTLDSDRLSTIGPVTDTGGGTYSVTLTAGTATGLDRFVVTADDGDGITTLAPNPALQYFVLGDLDGSGQVNILDFLLLLGLWGPCPDPCIADLDGDGAVTVLDFLIQLANWG